MRRALPGRCVVSGPLTVRIPSVIDSALTGNGRAHRMKKHRLFQELKATTGWALKAEAPGATFAPGQFPLTLDYVIARKRFAKPLDDDNAKIGVKACQDAVAAHLGIDDKHFRVGIVQQIRDPDGIGYVDVCITPADAQERTAA